MPPSIEYLFQVSSPSGENLSPTTSVPEDDVELVSNAIEERTESETTPAKLEQVTVGQESTNTKSDAGNNNIPPDNSQK